MSFNQRVKNGRNATPSAPLSGPAAQHVGKPVQMARILPGTLCVELRAHAATPGLLLTPAWQVSDDGASWVETRPANNAANVALPGGASVVDLQGPLSLSAHRYARVVVTASGAEPASTSDAVGSAYSWLETDFV